MKVVLYMATTLSGMIANQKENTGWVSKTEWKNYATTVKRAGNMIIGRKTYDLMMKNDEFNQSKLNTIKTVVVTHKRLKGIIPKFISTAQSPQEAVSLFRRQGFKIIMLCGGGELNTSFMKEKLIDEIYVDIEPIVFGRGIPLFSDADFEANLELINTKKLSKNEIQLHYKVRK